MPTEAERDIAVLKKDITEIGGRIDRLSNWTKEQDNSIKDIDKEQGIDRERMRGLKDAVEESKKDIRSLAKIIDSVMKEASWKMMKMITWTIGIITGFLGISFGVLKMAGIL